MTRPEIQEYAEFRLPTRVCHFTSYEAWTHIERDGLVPQPIEVPPGVIREFGTGLRGNWAFLHWPTTERALLGQVLYTIVRKATTRVVGISFVCNERDTAQAVRRRPGFTEPEIVGYLHDGRIAYNITGVPYDQGFFHQSQPVVLIGATIAPERLVVEGQWALGQLGDGDTLELSPDALATVVP